MLRISRAALSGAVLAVVMVAGPAQADPYGASFKQKPLSAAAHGIAQQLISGKGRLNILYFGNSRVVGGWLPPPQTRGFCLAGLQPHTRARGLLVGAGFINPFWQPASGGALFSTVSTNGHPVVKLGEDVQIHTPWMQGVRLSSRQHITTSAVVPRGPISARDDLVFTVVYRRGPAEGSFVITPLSGATAATMKPLTSCARTVQAKDTRQARAAYVRITVSGVPQGSVVRGLKISGVIGQSHIYDLHAWTSAARGFVVGRIAVGGHGYPHQMRTTCGPVPRCARRDYVTNLASFDPDVVILQYANNQAAADIARQRHTGVADAVHELLERVREARKGRAFLTILQMDNRTPFKGSGFQLHWGLKDMLAIQAREPDTLLVNPNPHLPTDWPLQGKEQPSKYFRDAVHENPLGARAVWEAVFKDLQGAVGRLPAPTPGSGAAVTPPATSGAGPTSAPPVKRHSSTRASDERPEPKAAATPCATPTSGRAPDSADPPRSSGCAMIPGITGWHVALILLGGLLFLVRVRRH